MVLFLKKVRLLRYMEMREPLGTKCSGRASQRRVSRNDTVMVATDNDEGRASQRRVSRNQSKPKEHDQYYSRASQRRVSRNSMLIKCGTPCWVAPRRGA